MKTTMEDKQNFITTLMDSMKEQLLQKLHRVPEDWDGVELRWLIIEHVSEHAPSGSYTKKDKRYKDFYNELLIRNL